MPMHTRFSPCYCSAVPCLVHGFLHEVALHRLDQFSQVLSCRGLVSRRCSILNCVSCRRSLGSDDAMRGEPRDPLVFEDALVS